MGSVMWQRWGLAVRMWGEGGGNLDVGLVSTLPLPRIAAARIPEGFCRGVLAQNSHPCFLLRIGINLRST